MSFSTHKQESFLKIPFLMVHYIKFVLYLGLCFSAQIQFVAKVMNNVRMEVYNNGFVWKKRMSRVPGGWNQTMGSIIPYFSLLVWYFKVTWAGKVPQYCRNCKRFTRAQGNTTVKLLTARVLMWHHAGFMSDFGLCAMNHVRLLSKNDLHNVGRTTTVLCIHVWKTHLWSMLNYLFCVYPSPAKHKFCIFRSSVYAFI